MRRLIYAASLLLLLHHAAPAQTPRPTPWSVNGVVLDADGRPVPGAHVAAYPDGGLRGKLPMADADARGRFTIGLYKAGWFTVTANQLPAGFPSTGIPFYYPSVDPAAHVFVKESGPAPFATVRFGPRAGRVVGIVVDAVTNLPVEDARLGMCRAEAPRYCYRISGRRVGGRFLLLAPPAPFTLQVSAPGYEDWYGDGGAEGGPEVLRLGSSETKELRVRLKKFQESFYAPEPPALEAPRPLSPGDGEVFHHYPRQTRLAWSPVPGAASYTVEVEFCMPGGADGRQCVDPHPLEYRDAPPETGIEGTSYEFLYLGSQPGRWRVWAVDYLGHPGAKSAWFRFDYY